MATLKVLQLEPWMVYAYKNSELSEMDYEQVNPSITMRDGWYSKGHRSWFMIDGKAFMSSVHKHLKEDFDFQLKQLNHKPLTNRQRKAIKQLMADKLAPRSMKELYYTDTDWRSIREVRRTSWFRVNRIIKKIKKGRKKNA